MSTLTRGRDDALRADQVLPRAVLDVPGHALAGEVVQLRAGDVVVGDGGGGRQQPLAALPVGQHVDHLHTGRGSHGS